MLTKYSVISMTILLVGLMFIPPVKAQNPNTGNYWHNQCQQSPRGSCAAFVIGVAQALGTAGVRGYTIPYCLPRTVNFEQMADVFKGFLERHPQHRHNGATVLFIEAMKQAFPCTR